MTGLGRFRAPELLRSLCVGSIALVGLVLPAGAATLTPSFIDRTVVADAFAATGPQFSGQTNGDAGTGSLPLDLSVLSAAPTDGASADSSASQQSEINALSAQARGRATADVSVAEGAEDPFAGGDGETIFLLEFTVDVEIILTVTGLVEASELPGVGDAFAVVELLDIDSIDVLFSFTATDGESTPFAEMVTLLPGVNYELFASATAIAELAGPGPAADSASASFQFQLVPEPGTFPLLAGGLGLMAIGRRWRAHAGGRPSAGR